MGSVAASPPFTVIATTRRPMTVRKLPVETRPSSHRHPATLRSRRNDPGSCEITHAKVPLFQLTTSSIPIHGQISVGGIVKIVQTDPVTKFVGRNILDVIGIRSRLALPACRVEDRPRMATIKDCVDIDNLVRHGGIAYIGNGDGTSRDLTPQDRIDPIVAGAPH